MDDDPQDQLAAHLTGDVDWIKLRFCAPRPMAVHRCSTCLKDDWRQDGDWAVCVTCERKGRRVQRWNPSV